MEDDSLPRNLRHWFASLAVTAAFLAYCFQPLLPFMDRSELSIGAMLFGASFGVYPTLREKSPSFRDLALLITGLGMGAWGLITLAPVVFSAQAAAVANDRDCLRIQAAMQHPTAATRDDLPDVFQALNCRVQR